MIAQCAQPTLTEGVRRTPRRFKGSGEADLRGFSPKSATIAALLPDGQKRSVDILHLANSMLFAGSTVSRSRG
jgi:hypothetical protein